MQTVNLKDVNLHIADHGPKDAPALVFANSLGTDFRLWDSLLPHLPDNLRLIRYDKRGHGLSEETPGPYSIDQLADDAADLIRHLGLSNVVFVGLSIGGLIGQSLAARHGNLLRGLVISNSAAKIGDEALWKGRVLTIRRNGLASIGEPTMERWFSPAFRKSGAAAPWQRMLERQPVEGYIACCEAIAAADYHQSTAALTLPVQLIAGETDGSTPPDLMQATADLIRDARFETIPGVGHLPCVEAPKAYAEILIRFLKEIGHV